MIQPRLPRREEQEEKKGRDRGAYLDLSAGRLCNYFSVPVYCTGARFVPPRSIRTLPATVIVPCKNLLRSLSLQATFEWPRVLPLSIVSFTRRDSYWCLAFVFQWEHCRACTGLWTEGGRKGGNRVRSGVEMEWFVSSGISWNV